MRLRALDADQVRALHDTGHTVLDGVEISWHADDVHNLRHRVHALDEDADSAPYLVHVLLDGALVAARIGCHAAPVDGEAEIGYFVAPGHRGTGLGTAVVREFLGWLRANGVDRVRATIEPGNVASQALVDRVGFTHVGEEIDEEDGELMLVYELGLRGRSPGDVPA